jgi:cell division protein FtsZ
MQDEIRVTLVATGLGQPARPAQQERPSVRVVDAAPRSRHAGSDLEGLERPTALRRHEGNLAIDYEAQSGIDVLDIPAFLRKQAD